MDSVYHHRNHELLEPVNWVNNRVLLTFYSRLQGSIFMHAPVNSIKSNNRFIVFEETEAGSSCCDPTSRKKPYVESRSIKSDFLPIATIIFLYAAGCGSERLFQSMQVISVLFRKNVICWANIKKTISNSSCLITSYILMEYWAVFTLIKNPHHI